MSICRCYIPICSLAVCYDSRNDEWFFFRGAIRRKKDYLLIPKLVDEEDRGKRHPSPSHSHAHPQEDKTKNHVVLRKVIK